MPQRGLQILLWIPANLQHTRPHGNESRGSLQNAVFFQTKLRREILKLPHGMRFLADLRHRFFRGCSKMRLLGLWLQYMPVEVS
jgi:hypothetical protein